MIAKKKLRLDLSFGYTDQGLLLRGSQEVDSVFRPRVDLEHQLIFPAFHRDINGYDRIVQFDAVYGLASRFNLVASLPVATWHAHEVSHGSLQQEYGTTGVGDVLLGLRSALGLRGMVGGLSIKFPTGPYRIGGEFGGGIQDPTLQPGTGSVDFVASLQYSLPAELMHLRWSLAGSYQATTTNSLDYRFGNQAIVVAGAARALSKSLSASLQAKLFHEDRNRYLAQGVPSTGSTFVYLTPGLRLNVSREVSLYGFVLFVPYRYVNEGQLGPRVAFLTGLSKAF
ncbi:MAG TPA: hypothetical protein VN461_04895 [Vicinamibacteria bacterium]|nr:hypothetical protein [Vicinamibacteria bacterium]